jgi:hypothetical protein
MRSERRDCENYTIKRTAQPWVTGAARRLLKRWKRGPHVNWRHFLQVRMESYYDAKSAVIV